MSNDRESRVIYQNAAFAEATALTASSETPDGPVLALANSARGETWRSKGGWNQVDGFNAAFYFLEDLGSGRILRRRAKIVGNFPTADEQAAAVTAALNAAELHGFSWYSAQAPTLWLRARRPRRDLDLLTSGDALSPWYSWAQPTGGACDFAEATNWPTWQTDRVNGLPAVVFDETNDLITSPANISSIIGTGGVFTLFLVVKINTTALGTPVLFRNTTSNDFRLRHNGGNLLLEFVDSGGVKQTTKACSKDAWHVITCVYDGTNLSLGVDDTRTASLSNVAALAPTHTAETLRFGVMGGEIAEAWCLPLACDEAFRVKMEDALAVAHGITVASVPAWDNTYAASYDADAGKFELERTAGAEDWAPIASADDIFQADLASLERPGDLGCYDGLGFTGDVGDYTPGAGPWVGESQAFHSEEFVDLDLGERSCRVAIFDGVNDRLDLTPSLQIVLTPGIYLDQDTLAAMVGAQIVDQGGYAPGSVTVTWNPLTSKLAVNNVSSGVDVTLLFKTGAAAVGGTSAHRSLGFLDVDTTITNGTSKAAERQVWGWLPIMASIVLDHNFGAGGRVRVVVNDQPNEGQVTRGPASGSWTLRGDETKRLYVREAGVDSPVAYGRRYIRFVFVDCLNLDAFTEVAKLCAGPYQPLPPFEPDYEHGGDSLDRVSTTDFGAIIGEARPQPHRFRGNMKLLSYGQRVILEAFSAEVGLSRPFFFLEDPKDRGRVISWTWYMNLAAIPQFQHGVGGASSATDTNEPADTYETTVEFVENLP